MTWLGTEPWAGLSRGTQATKDPRSQAKAQARTPIRKDTSRGPKQGPLYKGPSQDPSIHGRTQSARECVVQGPKHPKTQARTLIPKNPSQDPRTQARTQAPKDPRQGQARTLIWNRKRRPGLDPSKGPPKCFVSCWLGASQSGYHN